MGKFSEGEKHDDLQLGINIGLIALSGCAIIVGGALLATPAAPIGAFLLFGGIGNMIGTMVTVPFFTWGIGKILDYCTGPVGGQGAEKPMEKPNEHNSSHKTVNGRLQQHVEKQALLQKPEQQKMEPVPAGKSCWHFNTSRVRGFFSCFGNRKTNDKERILLLPRPSR